MPAIYSYSKIITTGPNGTVVSAILPVDTNHQPVGVELCTIGGVTYISIPDGYTLPAQSAGLTLTNIPLPIATALHDQVCAASPHVQLIDKQTQAAIAQQYDHAAELKALRLGPTDPGWAAYSTYVAGCVAAGKVKKAVLGL